MLKEPIPSFRKIVITIIVIAILFVLGIIYFLGKSLPTSDTQKIVFPKNSAEVARLSDAEKTEVVAAITREGSIENCNVFRGVTINGSDYGTVCSDNFFLRQAADQGNPSLCKNLQAIDVYVCERDSISLALERGDSLQCSSLSTEGGKDFCITEMAISQAVKTRDSGSCSSISGSRDYCEQIALIASVLASGEKSRCDGLAPTLEKGCKEYFEKSVDGRNVECLSIESSPLFQDMCGRIRATQ